MTTVHSLSTDEASDLVDALIQREVSWVWSFNGTKRILQNGLTWKQKTLLLMLSEAGEVNEADLFSWLEHPGMPSFRKDMLKQLHKARFVEHDITARTIRLLPPGVAEAERLITAPKPGSAR